MGSQRFGHNWATKHRFSNSPSNECSGLISFRIDWCDLLVVQGTLERLLQHHNLKAAIFQHSAFFMVQLSHPYMTSRKTIALTFVSKVMFLLFNTLSRFVIAFLPRSKHCLISWLQSPSTVILEPKNMKSVTASTFSPCICHEVIGPDAIILVFKVVFQASFFILLFSPSSRVSLVPLHFLPLEWYSVYLRLLIFLQGYSISSKGFLPTVVDIMVIWIKFAHSRPF